MHSVTLMHICLNDQVIRTCPHSYMLCSLTYPTLVGHEGISQEYICSCLLISYISLGSNGANLSFSTALGIPDSGDACTAAGTCEKNSWIVGMVNAMPYIAIAFL